MKKDSAIDVDAAAATPPVAPAAAPAPPPAASPPPAPLPTAAPVPGLNPDTHCQEDGKLWREKFYGADGRRQQVEANLQRRIGELEAQIAASQAGLTERDATIAQLSQASADLSALREQFTTVQADAAMAYRLQSLIQYPELLSLQVTEEVTVGEGDAAVTETHTRNPVLTFLSSTTLEGDELVAALRDMAKAMGVRATAQAPVTPVATVAGAVPQPAAPAAPANELDAARVEAMKWHQLAIERRTGPNGEDPAVEEQAAWDRFRELQAAHAAAA